MVKQINLHGNHHFSYSAEVAIPFDSANNSSAATNTAAVVTIPADLNVGNIITQILFSYSGLPTSGTVDIKEESTIIWGRHHITAAGVQQIDFHPPLLGTTNKALTITLAAGGAGISGTLSVNGYKSI